MELLRTIPISLLLSDVQMPGASGVELLRRARMLMPELPALLMSASDKDSLAQEGILVGDTFLYQKPFAIADLLAKLEELLQPFALKALSRGF
jgi:CheY-like chemotaxis protein